VIQYAEYVKGKKQYEEAILSSEIYQKLGGLRSDVFYPMIPFRDEEDMFPVAEVLELPQESVLVCYEPGTEPVEKKLYIEANWAYEVITV